MSRKSLSNKNTSSSSTVSTRRREIELILEESLQGPLSELQRRILSVPALNGGFDKLTNQVDKIDQRVESIHDAIYDPDKGLFARVKDVENSKLDGIDKLEKDVVELQTWRDIEERSIEKDAQIADDRIQSIKTLELQVAELIRLKDRLLQIGRWVFVTFAGGAATILGKLIFDFIKGHVQFI